MNNNGIIRNTSKAVILITVAFFILFAIINIPTDNIETVNIYLTICKFIWIFLFVALFKPIMNYIVKGDDEETLNYKSAMLSIRNKFAVMFVLVEAVLFTLNLWGGA